MSSEVKNISEAKYKRRVATFSLVVSIFLVIIKVAVAYYSNSIGVFSEALNNGLDIVTVVITFIAIRAAVKPADKDHTYGHGKYENFSALLEVIIIAFLCFFIIYKSIQRIILKNFSLELNIYVFIILIISIIVNIIRVYFIGTTARRYNSFAFKAEFINYSSDIVSSIVVISGLYLAQRGFYLADPIASIIVSLIIISFSIKLLVGVVRNLLDYIPKEVTEKITGIINNFPEIKTINKIKVHEVGDIKFINIDLGLDDNIYLSQVENIKGNIKDAIVRDFQSAEIIVEIKPSLAEDNIDCVVKEIVLNEPEVKDLHNIIIYKVGGATDLSVHVEINKTLNLFESEKLTDRIEKLINERLTGIRNIYIHIEHARADENWDDITAKSEKLIRAIKENVDEHVLHDSCHKFTILKRSNLYNVAFHCRLERDINIEEAHMIISSIENIVKNISPDINEVSIHVEPD